MVYIFGFQEIYHSFMHFATKKRLVYSHCYVNFISSRRLWIAVVRLYMCYSLGYFIEYMKLTDINHNANSPGKSTSLTQECRYTYSYAPHICGRSPSCLLNGRTLSVYTCLGLFHMNLKRIIIVISTIFWYWLWIDEHGD